MLTTYLKIAWRNIIRHKGYSFINITGLAVGMSVSMLIGLWMHDELSFNTYFQKYDRIAQVLQQETSNGEVGTGEHIPIPLANELRTLYGEDFEYIVLSSFTNEHILAYEDSKFIKKGKYMGQEAPHLLTLKMLKGTRGGLQEPSTILLSQSVAQTLFGSQEPIGKIVRIDNKLNVKVTGVYQDLPYNTTFKEVDFIAPWDLYVSSQPWIKQARVDWENNSWQLYVGLSEQANIDEVTSKIKKIKLNHVPQSAVFNHEFFLHPMASWHLYSQWDKNGQAGGRIEYVWLFGIIGLFVLLLACINFMNLSTARSEKRAKEVGIRKTVGSLRFQLIAQFLSESMLVVSFAFSLCLLLTELVLPLFNEIADKKISILWTDPIFWLLAVSFGLLTGLLAGSYPALFLSSFQPVKVLKGTFQAGKAASLPRKILVVAQFTVSITLIISSVIVLLQIMHARNRPIGYEREGLISIAMNTPELHGQYNSLRNELLANQAVKEISTSSSPVTISGTYSSGFEWEGKNPEFREKFITIGVTHDFGKTVGWQFQVGRDFSRQFTTDSSGLVLNETAIRYMGLKDVVGKTIKWQGKSYQVLGVINDMVMHSPFEPAAPTIFTLNYTWANVINIKLNPALSASASLKKIESVFHSFNPGSPFDFKFVDQEYARKFATEERISSLALCFTVLAVFISCLGMFGLASFMAERRTKEIGVRKVLGASVFNIWSLLSKDFLFLVLIALLISSPVAYYLMSNWLEKYEYRTVISIWIFVLSGVGALLITLLTVSYQSIKAALLNPVKSLRTE